MWTDESEIVRYRGEKVLSGLFGVPKSKYLPNGQSVLSCGSRKVTWPVPFTFFACRWLGRVCFLSIFHSEGTRLG